MIGTLIDLIPLITGIACGYVVGRNLGVVLHEISHYLVARYYGLNPSMHLIHSWKKAGIYQGSVSVPTPLPEAAAIDTLPTTVSSRISKAPLSLLIIPGLAWILIRYTSLSIDGELATMFSLGVVGAIVMCASPSGSDAALADHDYRLVERIRLERRIHNHLLFEHASEPHMDEIVDYLLDDVSRDGMEKTSENA